jgi:hypothetical protein
MSEIPPSPDVQGDEPPELELVFEAEFLSDEVDSIVRVEDDGTVAMAYTWKNNTITGLVWLYNRGPAPLIPRNRTLPQANLAGYASEERFDPIQSVDDLGVEWDSEKRHFRISIRGNLHALLPEEGMPGWCVLSRRASPVARPLVVHPGFSSN